MDAFENSGYYYYYYKICIAHKFKHARVGGAVVTLYGNNWISGKQRHWNY